MLYPRFVVRTLTVVVMIVNAGIACGQDYPFKPIRILALDVGGGPDIVSRLIAPIMSSSLGQQMIIDNRDATIAPETVANSPPDGYTLLFIGPTFWIKPFLQTVPYDPVKEFSPVVLAAIAPNVLVLTPSLPVNSVKELIALAKARPGELNYASGTAGSANHTAAELFKSMAGVNIVHIPYKGPGPGLIDVIGGRVQMMFASAVTVVPHIKSGKVRALAVTTLQPTALAPGLPTVAASGLPGYEAVATFGMFAPAKTPNSIVNRLNQEVLKVLARADVKEKFFNTGLDTAGNSPEQAAATVKSEMVKWGKVIKDAGIKGD